MGYDPPGGTRRLIAPLREGWRVTVPDPRGHGGGNASSTRTCTGAVYYDARFGPARCVLSGALLRWSPGERGLRTRDVIDAIEGDRRLVVADRDPDGALVAVPTLRCL